MHENPGVPGANLDTMWYSGSEAPRVLLIALSPEYLWSHVSVTQRGGIPRTGSDCFTWWAGPGHLGRPGWAPPMLQKRICTRLLLENGKEGSIGDSCSGERLHPAALGRGTGDFWREGVDRSHSEELSLVSGGGRGVGADMEGISAGRG